MRKMVEVCPSKDVGFLLATNHKQNMKKKYFPINTFLIPLGLFCGALGAASAPAESPHPRGCIDAPPGLVAWWPLDGNTVDRVGANDGTLVNGPTFTAGLVNQAL